MEPDDLRISLLESSFLTECCSLRKWKQCISPKCQWSSARQYSVPSSLWLPQTSLPLTTSFRLRKNQVTHSSLMRSLHLYTLDALTNVLNISIVAMLLNVDLETVFNTEFVGTCRIFLHIKFIFLTPMVHYRQLSLPDRKLFGDYKRKT
jgi:hypothetical protein